jgi:hypothetical protein
MHDQMQKWKFGSNFRGQNWAVTNLPHLQESRPEIPRVEIERREHETPGFDKLLGCQLQSTPLTGSFLLHQGQLKSECPQQLMS